ncbi:MAG: VWA domain-containing protein, partial [Chloroflexota bacterium]
MAQVALVEARYRYGRWDGTQEFEPFTASDLMDELADRMLDDGDLWSAMRDMLQRGTNLREGRRMSGLRDLLERLRDKRQQWLQRYNLNSLMDDLKDTLEQVVQTEREGIQERLSNQDQGAEEQLRKMLENMASKHLEQLDQMPGQVGGRIQALRDYEFMDQKARQQFDELLESLKEQMLQNYFQGLKQGIGAMTPELMAQAQEMLRDLNDLLARHRRGDDSGFEQFIARWRQFFPNGIESVEQLAEYMQRQMAQMQSLLNS